MKDAAVSLVIFLAICIGLAFLLLALSNWHRHIERRLRAFRREFEQIKRSNDLEIEAANAECGIIPPPEHGVTKFRGRHYDAA